MSTVKITVANGSLEGKDYTFEKEADCIVGGAGDCHCALHIDPPSVLLRDLNSDAGTFVNEHKIGSAAGHVELQDGDEVRLGQLVMQVHIIEQAAT